MLIIVFCQNSNRWVSWGETSWRKSVNGNLTNSASGNAGRGSSQYENVWRKSLVLFRDDGVVCYFPNGFVWHFVCAWNVAWHLLLLRSVLWHIGVLERLLVWPNGCSHVSFQGSCHQACLAMRRIPDVENCSLVMCWQCCQLTCRIRFYIGRLDQYI